MTTEFEHFMAQCRREAGISPDEPAPDYSAELTGMVDSEDARSRMTAILLIPENVAHARTMGAVGLENLISLYIDHLVQSRSPDMPIEITVQLAKAIRGAVEDAKAALGFPHGAN